MFNKCSMVRSPAITETQKTLAANGAQDENRTHDLRITSALLYRLSYLGKGIILSPKNGECSRDRRNLRGDCTPSTEAIGEEYSQKNCQHYRNHNQDACESGGCFEFSDDDAQCKCCRFTVRQFSYNCHSVRSVVNFVGHSHDSRHCSVWFHFGSSQFDGR